MSFVMSEIVQCRGKKIVGFIWKRSQSLYRHCTRKIGVYRAVRGNQGQLKTQKKEKLSQLLPGWGAGIRTPIGRSRVGSPTIERHPNMSCSFVRAAYDTVSIRECQAAICIGSPCLLLSQRSYSCSIRVYVRFVLSTESQLHSLHAQIPSCQCFFYCYTHPLFIAERHIDTYHFVAAVFFLYCRVEGMSMVFASTRGPLVSTML